MRLRDTKRAILQRQLFLNWLLLLKRLRFRVQAHTVNLLKASFTDLIVSKRLPTALTKYKKSYAIQAGREIRVIAKPEDITDTQAIVLARRIKQKIETEMKYPGHIKVTVIREVRSVEYAR